MKQMKRKLWLFAAMTAASLGTFAAEWAKPVPNDCPLEDGQKYYIYSSDADKYFSIQSNQLKFDNNGTLLTLNQQSDGEWTISSSSGYLYPTANYVGADGKATDANICWYIEKQESGYSRIRPSKNSSDFSWTEYPDMWTGLVWSGWKILPTIATNKGFVNWYIISETEKENFISKKMLYSVMNELDGYGYDVSSLIDVYNTSKDKADFDAAIASVDEDLKELRIDNATEENPVDVTYKYMRNADFTEDWVNGGHNVPGWTMVPATFCGMGSTSTDSFYSHGKTLGSWASGAFGDNKVYQNLSGLKNGKYKLGNYGLWIRHTGVNGDPTKGGYIYAKVGDKVFREPLKDTGWYRGLSEVVFECNGGEAEIGIMFESTNIGQCVIIDFKLEYLGGPTLVEQTDYPITNRWATLCYPADVAIADGVQAFKVSSVDNDILVLDEIKNTIPASEPVLLFSDNAETITLPATSFDIKGATPVKGTDGNLLLGCFKSLTLKQSTQYVLQKQTEGIAFYRVNPSKTITTKPFRAYLELSDTNGSKLRLTLPDEEVTAIDNIEENRNTSAYHLDGSRATHLQKGKLYIIGNKKVIIK